MSEGHVTHYDDCGCQSAALRKRIAELEQRDGEFDKLHAVQVARVEILIGEKATLEAELSGVRQASATELAHAYAHAKTLRDALVRKNMALRALVEAGDSYREWSKDAPFGEALTAALVECASMNEVAQTPAQSLAAHDAEVLERAARAVVEGRSCKAQHPFQPGECEECHWFDGAANSARSALAAQFVSAFMEAINLEVGNA